MEFYNVKQASEILGISMRAVVKRCFKVDVRKKNNKYLIPETDVVTWKDEIQKLRTYSEPIPRIEDIDEINRLNETIKELLQELDGFKNTEGAITLENGNIIITYTKDTFDNLENKLDSFDLMKLEINLKDQHFAEKMEKEKETTTQYKNHYYNQRQVVVKMQQQTIQQLKQIDSFLEILKERNFIEATEKGVIPKIKS